MTSEIFIESFELPEVNKREVRRYLKAADVSEVNALIDECIGIAEGAIEPKVCFSMLSCRISGDMVQADNLLFSSDALVRCLNDSETLVVFCATLGHSFDRLLKRYSIVGNDVALVLQALGTERTEALCDSFTLALQQHLNCKDIYFTPRFSPGYGNFELEAQKQISDLLLINKNLGVSLTEHFQMIPSKSVTAVFGIRRRKDD